MGSIPGFRHKIVIAGNHDMILDPDYHTQFNDRDKAALLAVELPYTYVKNELINVEVTAQRGAMTDLLPACRASGSMAHRSRLTFGECSHCRMTNWTSTGHRSLRLLMCC